MVAAADGKEFREHRMFAIHSPHVVARERFAIRKEGRSVRLVSRKHGGGRSPKNPGHLCDEISRDEELSPLHVRKSRALSRVPSAKHEKQKIFELSQPAKLQERVIFVMQLQDAVLTVNGRWERGC
jgi:hypothetical protein